MSRFKESPFYNIYPKLDLHGETRYTMICLLDSFINDNIKLKNDKILIIHGIGNGILKKTTHEYLKKDKRISSFYIEFSNPGCTVVSLKLDKIR